MRNITGDYYPIYNCSLRERELYYDTNEYGLKETRVRIEDLDYSSKPWIPIWHCPWTREESFWFNLMSFHMAITRNHGKKCMIQISRTSLEMTLFISRFGDSMNCRREMWWRTVESLTGNRTRIQGLLSLATCFSRTSGSCFGRRRLSVKNKMTKTWLSYSKRGLKSPCLFIASTSFWSRETQDKPQGQSNTLSELMFE